MPTKGTSVKGIRLPDQVWIRIDEEAAGLGMSRNEYLARRITSCLPLVQEVRKSDGNVRISHQGITLKEVPDDDD